MPGYLGWITAQTFAPRFIGGQGIGIGYGYALHAFVAALRLPPTLAGHLRFFALSHCPTETLQGVGAENLLEVIANHLPLSTETAVPVGTAQPSAMTAEELHAVLAAYRGGYFNMLVTDDRCAAELLRLTVPNFRLGVLVTGGGLVIDRGLAEALLERCAKL